MVAIILITLTNMVIHIPKIIKAKEKYDAVGSALMSWAISICLAAALFYLLGR